MHLCPSGAAEIAEPSEKLSLLISLDLVGMLMSIAISIGGCAIEITLEIMSGRFNLAVSKIQHPENSMELGGLWIKKHLLLVQSLKGWEEGTVLGSEQELGCKLDALRYLVVCAPENVKLFPGNI